jgi:hypothetical protein
MARRRGLITTLAQIQREAARADGARRRAETASRRLRPNRPACGTPALSPPMSANASACTRRPTHAGRLAVAEPPPVEAVFLSPPPAKSSHRRIPRSARRAAGCRRRRLPPGTGLSTTNLRPRRCRALRKANSGRVPDLLVRRITAAVAGDDAGGTGPGSRCLYTTPASRDGPTVPQPRTNYRGTPSAVLDRQSPQTAAGKALTSQHLPPQVGSRRPSQRPLYTQTDLKDREVGGVWLTCNSPLGHKIKSLTSVFARGPLLSHTKAQVKAVGAHLPLGHVHNQTRVLPRAHFRLYGVLHCPGHERIRRRPILGGLINNNGVGSLTADRRP